MSAAAVAVVYGFLDAEQSASWVLLAAAVFGIGGNTLATANTPKTTTPVPTET